MAEAIGKQDRQTPSDDEVQAANDGHQGCLAHDRERSDGTKAASNVPRAQFQDTTGDAFRNDQRQDGVSVEMSGTKTDRAHDDLGTPVNAPTPAEEETA